VSPPFGDVRSHPVSKFFFRDFAIGECEDLGHDIGIAGVEVVADHAKKRTIASKPIRLSPSEWRG
jgi:hypothetical protein